MTTQTIVEPEAWRLSGLCATAEDLDLWHPVSVASFDAAQAVRICGQCPVRERCRDDYLLTPPTWRKGAIVGGWVWDADGRPKAYPADEAIKDQLLAGARS